MRPDPKNHLDPRAMKAWRLGMIVGTGVPVVAVAAFGVLLSWLEVLSPVFAGFFVLLIFVLAALSVAVVPRIRYARWRYEVTDDEIDLREGVMIVRRVIVPLVRVQHVDTHQGPIMRMFGLAGVRIATAATVYDIPALSMEVADSLRDRIAQLARLAEDDV